MRKYLLVLPVLLLMFVTSGVPVARAQQASGLGEGFDRLGSVRCDVINGTTMMREIDTSKERNPYLEMAQNPETQFYDNYRVVVDEFLTRQDELFAERFDELKGSSLQCDLSRSDVPSAFADKRIEPLPNFVSARLFELRQADCALFHIKNSLEVLCDQTTNISYERLFECDTDTKQRIEKMRQDLRIAMQLAIMQLDEMTLAWPIHKRLECLNESLIEFREIFVKIVEQFSKFPKAFINASQST